MSEEASTIPLSNRLYNRPKIVYFNKWYWGNWTDASRKMKLDHFLMPSTSINSKWIKDWNIRPQTIKILEENIDSKFSGISSYQYFFSDVSPRQGKQKKKMGLHQSKKFCTVKETINKTKRQPTEWENIFANYTSNKGLISKIY